MLKAGECAPLFSNAATTYRMNKMWWERHRITFQKWWEVIDDEYNPLWTNDSYRTVEEHKKSDGSIDTRTAGNLHTQTDNAASTLESDSYKDESQSTTKTRTDEHVTRDQSKGEIVNGVSAYDSSAYSPHDKSETRDAHTGDSNSYVNSVSKGELVHNGSKSSGSIDLGHINTDNEGTSNTVTKDKTASEVVEHTYGNNSVLMTGQKLMESEIQVRQRLDLYNMMADIFCDEMLVWLYV